MGGGGGGRGEEWGRGSIRKGLIALKGVGWLGSRSPKEFTSTTAYVYINMIMYIVLRI